MANSDFNATEARILEATGEVLVQNGHRKLSMSDVASEAGVSRPTLYRWFPSKDELLEGFGLYEQAKYDQGMVRALQGLNGLEALNAALEFIADFQRVYSLGQLSDIEPEHVIHQMNRTLPIMRKRLAALISDDEADIIAGTIVRVAICHYVIGGDDRDQLLDQLRHAAGIVLV